jgi:hypothetical protein
MSLFLAALGAKPWSVDGAWNVECVRPRRFKVAGLSYRLCRAEAVIGTARLVVSAHSAVVGGSARTRRGTQVPRALGRGTEIEVQVIGQLRHEGRKQGGSL